jgi:SH3-like domain-containing protein
MAVQVQALLCLLAPSTKPMRRALFALTIAFLLPSVAWAEFRAVQSAAAILYDGPSKQAKKLFIAPRGMPVEVLSILPAWIKVRDQSGDVLWIEKNDLGAVKAVLTIVTANIRQAASDASPVLFQIERGVLLEITEPLGTSALGWLKVKHPDGSYGYLKVNEIYGL